MLERWSSNNFIAYTPNQLYRQPWDQADFGGITRGGITGFDCRILWHDFIQTRDGGFHSCCGKFCCRGCLLSLCRIHLGSLTRVVEKSNLTWNFLCRVAWKVSHKKTFHSRSIQEKVTGSDIRYLRELESWSAFAVFLNTFRMSLARHQRCAKGTSSPHPECRFSLTTVMHDSIGGSRGLRGQ